MTDNMGQLSRCALTLHARWQPHYVKFHIFNLVCYVTFCTLINSLNQIWPWKVSISDNLFVLLDKPQRDYVFTVIWNCEQICSILSSVFQLNLTQVWLLAALFCWAPSSVHCTAGGDVTINSYDNTEPSLAEPATLLSYWSIQILAWLITPPAPGRRGKRGKGVEQASGMTLFEWSHLDKQKDLLKTLSWIINKCPEQVAAWHNFSVIIIIISLQWTPRN